MNLCKSSIKKALKTTGCSSMTEFSLRAGLTRPALYKSFNESPYKFNDHFDCARFYRARLNLSVAKTDLELAQKAFDLVKRHEKKVVG